MRHQSIAIFGGSGFIGSHLVASLTREQRATRVLTRRRERQRHLLVNPTCEVVEGNLGDDECLRRTLQGCDAAINLVGILNENRAQHFDTLQAELPERIAQACVDAGVGRLLHMSALHAAPGAPSHYLRSKALGEDRAHARGRDGLAVTSFRPSVVFGDGDSFINRFADIVKLSPGVIPLACAQARFAPVYVGDVVAALRAALDDENTFGKRYDLCGPQEYALGDIVRMVASWMARKRVVVPLPDGLARLQAAVMENLPGQPFSTDNYFSLTVDSVCRGAPAYDGDLADLGIAASPMSAIVPGYLDAGDGYGFYAMREKARR